MAQTSNLLVEFASTLSSVLDHGTATFPAKLSGSYTLANGTGANQAQTVFSDQRTLAASTAEDLDLSGTLTDAFGATIAFTKVKAICVKAAAANTNDVEVGGQATNGFSTIFSDASDVVLVKPGGMFALIAPDANGYAVTAGTGDLLQITNGGAGTSVTYDVVIVGV